MINFKLRLLIFLIISFSLFILSCDSGNDVSTDSIEPEEIIKTEPEIETEPDTGEFEIESDPEIKVVVNVDVLRLRSGPSTDHEILDRLRLGSILIVTGEQDDWLQVKLSYQDQEGWVHGDFVVKPEDPEKLYEVLSVKVQPIGYKKEDVAKFVEDFTSFSCSDLVFPEFSHPNEIDDFDLIWAIQESKYQVIPKYYTGYGETYIVSFKDVQNAARAVFGLDLKDIESYTSSEFLGMELLSGCAQSTTTRVLNIIETEKEFLVDVVHLIYYHCPYEMDFNYLASENSRYDDFESHEAFIDNNLNYITDIEIIEEYIKTFPVRRYVISKEGDGVCYIRQSYLLDD